MSLKLLSPEEIPLLEPLIQSFFDEGNIQGKFDPKHAAKVIRGYVQSGAGFVLCQGSPILGAIGGFIYPDFATGDLCASEYFWYVFPKVRGGTLGIRLFKAFEQEAIKRGAKRILMMHLVTTQERDATMRSIYETNGYRLKEQVFTKDIN